MKSEYTEIVANLADISKSVGPLSDEEILQGDTAVIDPLFHQLDTLAAQDVGSETVERLLYASELTQVLAEISRLRNLYNLRLEIQQARALLETPDPWGSNTGLHLLSELCAAGRYGAARGRFAGW